MSYADGPCSLLPYRRPPLTVEEQLRVVCDAWLSDCATHRCVWTRHASDTLTLLFSYIDQDGTERPRLFLDLVLRERPPLVVAAITAWTWSGCSIPLEVQTAEDVAEHLELKIDWKGLEPF